MLADAKPQSLSMLSKTDETEIKGSWGDGNNKDKECVADSLIHSFRSLSISDRQSFGSNLDDGKYPEPVQYYKSEVSSRTSRFHDNPGTSKANGNGDILSSSENKGYSIEDKRLNRRKLLEATKEQGEKIPNSMKASVIGSPVVSVNDRSEMKDKCPTPSVKASLEIYLRTASDLQRSKEMLQDTKENGIYYGCGKQAVQFVGKEDNISGSDNIQTNNPNERSGHVISKIVKKDQDEIDFGKVTSMITENSKEFSNGDQKERLEKNCGSKRCDTNKGEDHNRTAIVREVEGNYYKDMESSLIRDARLRYSRATDALKTTWAYVGIVQHVQHYSDETRIPEKPDFNICNLSQLNEVHKSVICKGKYSPANGNKDEIAYHKEVLHDRTPPYTEQNARSKVSSRNSKVHTISSVHSGGNNEARDDVFEKDRYQEQNQDHADYSDDSCCSRSNADRSSQGFSTFNLKDKKERQEVDFGASLRKNYFQSTDSSRFVVGNKDNGFDISKVTEQLEDISMNRESVYKNSLINKRYAQVKSSHFKDKSQLSKICQGVSWEEKLPKKLENNKVVENIKDERAEHKLQEWQNTSNAHEVDRSRKSLRPTNLDKYQASMRNTNDYKNPLNKAPEISHTPNQSYQDGEQVCEKKEQKRNSTNQTKYNKDIPTKLDDRTFDDKNSGAKKSENDCHSGGETKVDGEMPFYCVKVDDKTYLKRLNAKTEMTLIKSGDQALPSSQSKSGDQALPSSQSETQPAHDDPYHKDLAEEQPQEECPTKASSDRKFREVRNKTAAKQSQDSLVAEVSTSEKDYSLDDPKCKKHYKEQKNDSLISEAGRSEPYGWNFHKNTNDNVREESCSRQEKQPSHKSIGWEGSMRRNRPFPDEDDIDYQSEDSTTCELAYKKISWSKYIQSFKHVSDWDDDCKDPIEKAFSKSRLGTAFDKNSKFYTYFTAHEYHDMNDDILRGWNDGDYVYVGERATLQQDFVKNTTSATKGGARPKTYVSNIPRDVSTFNSERPQTTHSDESDCENLKDSGGRRVYGLPNEDFKGLGTSDERRIYGLSNEDFEGGLETSDESEDEFRSGMSQGRYDEFVALNTSEKSSDHQDEANSNNHSEFTPEDLVLYLSRRRNFTSDTKAILRNFAKHGNVLKFIQDHREVFSINGESVELRPRFTICPSYLVEEGCLDRSSCEDLHICYAFVLNSCNDEGCINGHSLGTSHNRKILKKFYLGKMDPSVAMDVLQKALLGPMQYPPLDICKDYSFKGCTNENCKFLHICIDYVGGLTTCSRPKCSLNHNLHEKQCRKLLDMHNIDISNLCKDDGLLTIVKASPEMIDLVQTYGSEASTKMSAKLQPSQFGGKQVYSADHKKTAKQGSRSATTNQPSCNKMSYSQALSTQGNSKSNSVVPQPHSEEASGCASVPSPVETKGSTKKKSVTSHIKDAFKTIYPKSIGNTKREGTNISTFSTVWSTYAHGDVAVPEICKHALKSVCRYESTGCRRLHARKPFHWQFKLHSGEWMNLQPHQVSHLEQESRKPFKDNAVLPLPISTCEPEVITIVLKDVQYLADFQEMTLTNNLTDEVYELRRLHATGPSGIIWYFKDISGMWIEYGKSDSLGFTGFATKITSVDIEKSFQNGDAKFSVKSNIYDYTLDFKKMLQVNKKTNRVRDIRRRPKP